MTDWNNDWQAPASPEWTSSESLTGSTNSLNVTASGQGWTIQQKEILLKDLNEYLQTEEWKNVFNMFVNSNCAVFDDPQQLQFSEGQVEIWDKFKDFTRHQINASVEHYSAQGTTVYDELEQLASEVINDPQTEQQLYITAQTKNLMELVLLVPHFGKYMAERNQEMDAEALEGGHSDAGGSDADSDNDSRKKKHKRKGDKKSSRHKSRKLRKLKTTKLLRRPSERFLDAVMAQPEAAGEPKRSNQHEKWQCLYCNTMNSYDARSCILCGLAPASESCDSLVKRCKKAKRVVNDFIAKQKFDNVKTVAKRWVARAAHMEVVAHMLYADDRAKDAVKLVEAHKTICNAYSNLRSAYLTALNTSLTLYMAMCEWDKAQDTAKTAFTFCVEQSFIIPIENPWKPDFGELTDEASPAAAFDTDSHVLFVETPAPFSDSELKEMNLQFLVLLMNICTLYTLYNHEAGGAAADDYCARYAEHLNDARSIAFLRRRLTVLIEVYLSRGLHNQAAPLSQQLSGGVMSSPLLTEPLLMSACMQCAKSVVEVLLAQGADVEAVGTNGCTPLFSAVRSKSHAEQMTKMLLDANANPDTVDNDGCTSLHYAASTGNSALVAMLMGYGADTTVTDNYGSLPADYAAQVRDTESQLLLLGADSSRSHVVSPTPEVGSEGKGVEESARGSDWVECFDEETGYPFFVNTVTGESEWASKDVWEAQEREVQEKLEEARHDYDETADTSGEWAEYVAQTDNAQLEEGDRQAWNEISQVRSDLRNLNDIASGLQARGQEQLEASTHVEAKYDEVLEGTKSAMEEVKAQLAGLMSQQMDSVNQQMQEQKAALERHASATQLQLGEYAAQASVVEEQKKQIENMKSKEEQMKEKLKLLEAKFEKAQKDKAEAKQAAVKEGLKLEMKQHVAMKEKEKIISNFKDNLRALDEGLAKERSRHRLNLLKKLQLRREKNARKKAAAQAKALPADLKKLRPKDPPPVRPPPGRAAPPGRGPPPAAAGAVVPRRASMGSRPKVRMVGEAVENDAGGRPKSKSMHVAGSVDLVPVKGAAAVSPAGTPKGSPKAGAGSPGSKRRRRRRKPPPPPPGGLPKLAQTV